MQPEIALEPRPACLTREDRELTLYVPQPHTAAQLAEISRNFERCVEALGSSYEYTGVTVGNTLVRSPFVGLPHCSTLVATLEWRDGGEELPFTPRHVESIGKTLNVEFPVWGTAEARIVYDPFTELPVATVVTLEIDVDDPSSPHSVILPNHGRLPYSTVRGIEDVEIYPAMGRSNAAHFVVPRAPRHGYSHNMQEVYKLAAHVSIQMDLFLTAVPTLVDVKPSDNR